jgi:uncharacterized RDD family membrane protein YckC
VYDQAPRFITPEAVAVDVRHADPGTRIAARGLDLLVQLGLIFVVFLALGVASQGRGGSTPLVIVALVLVFLAVFGYPAVMEATWRGRTLGKAAFGLRVVTSQGAPITFRHAAIRSALFVVDGLLIGPAIGVISLLVSRDTVRLGDLAAGTVVLREETGAAMPVATPFPLQPGWEQYVDSLDVSRLGPEASGLVRSYVLRRSSLPPDVRDRLAMDVAGRIADRLALPPQPMPADWFLWCVAAAVQRRNRPAWP